MQVVSEGSTAVQPAAVGFEVQVVREGNTDVQPESEGFAVH